MRPEYPLPEPHLDQAIPWRWLDDPQHGRIVELDLPERGTVSRQRAWTGTIHEALEAKETLTQMTQRLVDDPKLQDDADKARSRLGTYLYQLWNEGYVQLDFPGAPERFQDRYRVDRCLGRGGVGVAWRCHDDREAGRVVVVKHAWDFFQPYTVTDQMMRSEDETLRQLRHPGIIERYDAFEANGHLHLVRECVDGHPFAATHTPATDFFRRAQEATAIIAHLHEQGYLLLDARPANFFTRTQDDRMVLVDVGTCQRHEGIGPDHERRLRHSLGSPGFSAPETRKRHRASTASDVFGLGRLLYAVAANKIPLKDLDAARMRDELNNHPATDLLVQMCDTDKQARPSIETVADTLANLAR